MTGDKNSIDERNAPQSENERGTARRRFLRGGLVASGPLLVTLANRPALAWNQYCNGSVPQSMALSRNAQLTITCHAYSPTIWKSDCNSHNGQSFTDCNHTDLMPDKTWAHVKSAFQITSYIPSPSDNDTVYDCLGNLGFPLRAHVCAGFLNASRWGNPFNQAPELEYDTYGYTVTEFRDWINSAPPDALDKLRTLHHGD